MGVSTMKTNHPWKRNLYFIQSLTPCGTRKCPQSGILVASSLGAYVEFEPGPKSTVPATGIKQLCTLPLPLWPVA